MPRIQRDIARYVLNCPNCLAHKPLQQPPAGRLHAHPVEGRWKQQCRPYWTPPPVIRRSHEPANTTRLFHEVDRETASRRQPRKPLTNALLTACSTDTSAHRLSLSIMANNLDLDSFADFFNRLRLNNTLRRFMYHIRQPGGARQPNNKNNDPPILGRDHKGWDKDLAALQFAMNTAK